MAEAEAAVDAAASAAEEARAATRLQARRRGQATRSKTHELRRAEKERAEKAQDVADAAADAADAAVAAAQAARLGPMPTRKVSEDLSREALGLIGLTTRKVSLNNFTSWL